MTEVEAIKRTVYEYQHFYNARRVDDVVDLFTEDGVLRSGNMDLGCEGRDRIRAFLDSYLGVGDPAAEETSLRPGARVVNPVIELAGDGATASVEADFFALLWLDGNPHLASMGRTRYELVREEDRWRIRVLETTVRISKATMAVLAARTVTAS